MAADSTPSAKRPAPALPVAPNPAPDARACIDEHARILAELDGLETLLEQYRDAIGTPEARTVLAAIRALIERLKDNDAHHQREEEELFPRLTTLGQSALLARLKSDHDELKLLRAQLGKACVSVTLDTEEIVDGARVYSHKLRDHLHREGAALLPLIQGS